MDGIQLRKLKEKAGITSAEISRKMNCSRAYITQLEKAENLNHGVIKTYLEACGYTVESYIEIEKDGKIEKHVL